MVYRPGISYVKVKLDLGIICALQLSIDTYSVANSILATSKLKLKPHLVQAWLWRRSRHSALRPIPLWCTHAHAGAAECRPGLLAERPERVECTVERAQWAGCGSAARQLAGDG